MHKFHLPPSQYDELMDYVISNPSKANLLFELLMRTGMRVEEMVIMERKHFDSKLNKVYIAAVKGSNSRWLSVSPEFFSRITPIIESLTGWRTTLGLLISTKCGSNLDSQKGQMRRLFHKIMNRVLGIDHGYKMHSLRHTFALRLLMATGRDILKVQNALGHKNIASTAKYLQYLTMEDIQGDILSTVEPHKNTSRA